VPGSNRLPTERDRMTAITLITHVSRRPATWLPRSETSQTQNRSRDGSVFDGLRQSLIA
jgi:hypothetical protein